MLWPQLLGVDHTFRRLHGRCFPLILGAVLAVSGFVFGADPIPAPGSKLPAPEGNKVITAADVTVEKVGSTIPVSAIGEPVGGVTLSAPRWVDGRPRWGNQTDSGQNKLPPSDLRSAIRSITYQGIAEAMAEQWGNLSAVAEGRRAA